jgi:uncharacterized protein (DUF2252 family)
MLQSPLAFFRGAASIMASDLQRTPVSGIETQICGDAHLANFGAFATPERRLVFDVNDFDETTIGPWEWDLKRLAASFAIAGRQLTLRPRETHEAVVASVRSYRERMHGFAAWTVLDTWYARIDEEVLGDIVRSGDARKRAHPNGVARASDGRVAPRTVRREDGALAIADDPPKVFHPPDAAAYESYVRALFAAYQRTLTVDRKRLFKRFDFVDAAYKVVGVGSVGTRCSVALFAAGEGDALWLQVKEARASVYERYAADRAFANHGERVVVGQRLMQSASDLFLGWARADDGHAFYVRQLRDMKMSPDVATMSPDELRRYAGVCGWALARAHARAGGSAAAIAGYLGRGDAFDEAIAAFSRTYADRNELDYRALQRARDEGRIVADERA